MGNPFEATQTVEKENIKNDENHTELSSVELYSEKIKEFGSYIEEKKKNWPTRELESILKSINSDLETMSVSLENQKEYISNNEINEYFQKIKGYDDNINKIINSIREKSGNEFPGEKNIYDIIKRQNEHSQYINVSILPDYNRNIDYLSQRKNNWKVAEQNALVKKQEVPRILTNLIKNIDFLIKKRTGIFGIASALSSRRRNNIDALIARQKYFKDYRDILTNRTYVISDTEFNQKLSSLSNQWNISDFGNYTDDPGTPAGLSVNDLDMYFKKQSTYDIYFSTLNNDLKVASDEIKTKIKECLSEFDNINKEAVGIITYVDKASHKKEIPKFLKENILPTLYKELNISNENNNENEEWGNEYENINQIHQRSFENIRKSVELYLNYYADKNGIDNLFQTIDELKNEIKNVKQSYCVKCREDYYDIEKILSDGKVKNIEELVAEASSEPEKESLLKKGGGKSAGGNVSGYYKHKEDVSKALFGDADIKKGIVYGILGNINEPIQPNLAEPGSQYGNIVFILNEATISKRVVYTERDSLTSLGLTSSLDSEEKELSLSDKCQVTFEHALITKAIYNIDAKYNINAEINSEATRTLSPREKRDTLMMNINQLRYVEAHILGGLSLNEVKEVQLGTVDRRDYKRQDIRDRVIKFLQTHYPKVKIVVNNN